MTEQAITAQLSSMEYTISDLARRISELGDELTVVKNERGASEMYQIEKTLKTAARRLAQAQRTL